jgi:hypothetical protein
MSQCQYEMLYNGRGHNDCYLAFSTTSILIESMTEDFSEVVEPPSRPKTLRRTGHDFLLGLLLPRSQFFNVLKQIASFAASLVMVVLLHSR